MPRDKLHQSLNDLQRQLEDANSIDEHAREHLRSVMGEIHRVLERSDPRRPGGDEEEDEEETGLMDRLRESVQHFEGEHPTITKTVLELIATLRTMGF